MENRTFSAVVSKIVDEGPSARTFRLELADGGVFRFLPGQSVAVAFPGDPPGAVFPISSSPLDEGYVEITLGPTCDFSKRLLELSGGESLELSGPIGDRYYRDEIKHAVLLSVGSGIASYRSMMRYVLQKGLPNKIALLYVERTPSRILFRSELEEFSKRGIAVTVTITGPIPAEEPWDGRKGPITPELVRKALAGAPEAVCFVSGDEPSVETLNETLLKAGVDKRRILAEKTCIAP
ncbi:MAG: FAD-dependent oxidoreductase [Elusimicrobiota bacterium]